MNITAKFEELGHKCITCHGKQNTGIFGAPPGASNDLMPDFNWHMPPAGMMLRKEMSKKELCEIWTDPSRNNNRGSLQDRKKTP